MNVSGTLPLILLLSAMPHPHPPALQRDNFISLASLQCKGSGREKHQRKRVGGHEYPEPVITLPVERGQRQEQARELEMSSGLEVEPEMRKHLLPDLRGGPASRVKQRCHVHDAAGPVPGATGVIVFQHDVHGIVLKEAQDVPEGDAHQGPDQSDHERIPGVHGVVAGGIHGPARGRRCRVVVVRRMRMMLFYVEILLRRRVLHAGVKGEDKEL